MHVEDRVADEFAGRFVEETETHERSGRGVTHGPNAAVWRAKHVNAPVGMREGEKRAGLKRLDKIALRECQIHARHG
jgi:hypothetical protein